LNSTNSVNQIFSDGIKYLPRYPGCAASAFCATRDLPTCGAISGCPLQATWHSITIPSKELPGIKGIKVQVAAGDFPTLQAQPVSTLGLPQLRRDINLKPRAGFMGLWPNWAACHSLNICCVGCLGCWQLATSVLATAPRSWGKWQMGQVSEGSNKENIEIGTICVFLL